jgi:fibronectin-binding autotransporter adhesin
MIRSAAFFRLPRLLCLGIAIFALHHRSLKGQDSNWDNFSTNFQWDLVSPNWNAGGTWTNGHGAIFDAMGTGAINMSGPISVNSLRFKANGYSINGTGVMTFVNGTSTETTGVVNVDAGVTAQINVPIQNGVTFQKLGSGVLELGGTGNSFTGQFPLTGNGNLRGDILIGAPFSSSPVGGTLRLLNNGVLPSTTNVAIGAGYLDIGANNVTLNQLTFTNQTVSGAWNTTLNANNGVVGSGTLRVLGDIHVIGVTGSNFGNSIAANVDLGGGTQIVRVGVQSSFGLNTALMFTGSLFNGSLTKSFGYQTAGVFGSVDGISLFGNNTYTGASIFNAGTSIATGTNLSTSILAAGTGGPGGSQLILQGANGSFQSATSIKAVGGSAFVLDNNAAQGATGNNVPNIPAAQNNDRIRDDAAIELRDGVFAYRGLASTTAFETFGSLDASGGHNGVTIAPNGGTSTVTATNLTLGPRATLSIGTAGATGTAVLGTNAKLIFTGSVPAADSTGIIRGMVTGTATNSGTLQPTPADLVVYDAVDGFKAYTGYATDFSTAGTNVNVSAASTLGSSQSINALKATTASAFTTTIGAGNTLTVDSGMMISTSSAHTLAGGTLAFGANPGMIFGAHTINSAVTGSNGLIHATGNVTLGGDLSGLTGVMSLNGTGTTTLVGNSFTGEIHVRRGSLLLQQAQTGATHGAIRLGVPGAEADLVGTFPGLQFNSTGANLVTQIDRDIIVDNGGLTVSGLATRYSLVSSLSPLSNASGSQTLTGDITLNSDLRIQGGGGGTSATVGSTIFQGAMTGPGKFWIPNGRVLFDTSSVMSNLGGIEMGDFGFTAQVTFQGTATGNANMLLRGGNNAYMRYAGQSSITGGLLTVEGTAAVIPLNTSTIGNTIEIRGSTSTLRANVGSGTVATWAGPLTGNGTLSMQTVFAGATQVSGTNDGMGTLILANNANSHTGAINVNTGTLLVNGNVASSTQLVTVGATGTLGGNGMINRNVVVNGSLAPGNSPGLLTINGNLTMNSGSAFRAELNGALPGSGYDQLAVNGLVSLGNANLFVTGGFQPDANYTYFLVNNDLNDAITGTFNGLAEGSSVSWTFGGNAYSATLTYLADFSTQSISGGNDVALFNVIPEPGAGALLALTLVGCLFRRRQRAQTVRVC